MTDQAAAKALVAVGRLDGVLGEEESNGEIEYPKKVASRGKSEAQEKRDREQEMPGRGPRTLRSLRTGRRSRESNDSG